MPAGAPLNFTAIGQSSTSVRLQWEPPASEHRHGEIVMYELIYHDRRDPADDWPTNTSDTHIVIDGLEPTTNYIFQIRAYTGKGAGPWSNQLPFQTFAAQRAYTSIASIHGTHVSSAELALYARSSVS